MPRSATSRLSLLVTPFIPTPWLANRHAQTLLASFQRTPRLDLTLALEELPDGDAVEWLRAAEPEGKPAVLLLPGLEGSINSSYAPLLLAAFAARGWCGAILHHRGAACRPNRLVRGCHSGDWSDAAAVTERLRLLGATRVAAVGVSLGGNMLLKWLGETGAANPLAAAVAVSVPFELGDCADALDSGFARIYRGHLLRDMRRSMLAKRHLNSFDRHWLGSLRTFRQFDDAITARQNGFANVEEYYLRCSCRQFLGGIARPTTIIHALDDPFVPRESLPESLPPAVRLVLTTHGGHVGFLTGRWPRSWLPEAVVAALAEHLGGSSTSST